MMISYVYCGPLTEEEMLMIASHAKASGKKCLSYNKIKKHPLGKNRQWRWVYMWDNKEFGRLRGGGSSRIPFNEFFKLVENKNQTIKDRLSEWIS